MRSVMGPETGEKKGAEIRILLLPARFTEELLR
jgi:hypothetical protein